MNPLSEGVTRGLRGIRTGDQRSLYTGALLVAYGLWKRNRRRRDLLYSRTLAPGEAVLVKSSRGTAQRIVIGDDLADQIKASRRAPRKRKI